MKKFSKIFMVSCKEVTDTISKELPLTVTDKFRLGFHLYICPMCRSFKQQIEKLKDGIVKNLKVNLTEDEQKQAKNLEDKIIKEIRKKN